MSNAILKPAFAFLMLLLIFNSCNITSRSGIENKAVSRVNVFVGTDAPGNTYPGVALPFGMVQLSPDNGLGGWARISGYAWPDSTIAGFSHKHLSGTGAGDLYDILVMPLNSSFNEDLWPRQEDFRPYSKFSHKKEKAYPGYYSVELLSSGISAELTATARVGFHRYTFPADDSSRILIDLGYALNWDKAVDTHIQVEDETTLSGYRKSTGWASDQREYFLIKVSSPVNSFELFKNNQLSKGNSVQDPKTKAILYFTTSKNEQIKLKVALSSVSVEGAKKNMEAELPGWDFDNTMQSAVQKWEDQLSCIRLNGSDYQQEVFYTNLYHCFLTPSLHSDVDGQYKAPDSTIKRAEGFKRYDTFSLWDTYRAAHPLYTLLCPEDVSDFIASFLAHYDESGLLPVWSMQGNETDMMIGYHSVPVIVDAFLKGLSMDAQKAYEACRQMAMSNAWDLEEYKRYGYVPYDGKNKGYWSVSKTIEYSFDDYCIAQFAKALNKTDDYHYFSERALSWKHHYDASTSFLRPKSKDGQFLAVFNPGDYTDYFCESNAWQYLWAAQHHIDTLIDLMGKDKFGAKLDSMFRTSPEPDENLPIFSTGMIGQYAHGNEPGHHVPYLYSSIGRPYETQRLVREIMNTLYSNKPDGYCGNEDCGQMSAWYIWSALGFYPVNPMNGLYVFGSPAIDKAVISLPGDKKLTITAHNNSMKNVYVQSVKLNGSAYSHSYITHDTLMKGGHLEFFMGELPPENRN